MWTSLALAIGYAAAMTGAFATNSGLYGFGGLALLSVLLGLLAGRSWAILTPLVAIPLLNGWFNGSDSDVGGFWPTAAIGLFALTPIALVFVALGLGLRFVLERRHKARRHPAKS